MSPLAVLVLSLTVAAIDAGSLPKVNRPRHGKASLSAIAMRDANEPLFGPLYRTLDSTEDFDYEPDDYLFKSKPFVIAADRNRDNNTINNFIKALRDLGRNVNDQPKYQEPIHGAEVRITFDSKSGVGRAGESDALVLPIP